MSHCIEKPYDLVFSTEGTEWHGLATHCPEGITGETVEPILFPIITGEIVVSVDGETVKLDGHKALIADYRKRSDLGDASPLLPLHVPKSSYGVLDNRAVWEAMQNALRDVSASVSCVGTLEAGRKFFVSAKLGDGGTFKVKTARGEDSFLANLNFITSHDGSLAVEAYDSMIRIVCMNTLRASRSCAGDVGFKVYHTSGADLALANMADLVNAILTGRETFRNQAEYLATVEISPADARFFALGYFAKLAETVELATRSRNAADEIAVLFSRGTGNNGRTLYDLLNGATEYWTHGDGTGKDSDKATKLHKASFGAAAEHKEAFFNALCAPADTIAEFIETGKRADAAKVAVSTTPAQAVTDPLEVECNAGKLIAGNVPAVPAPTGWESVDTTPDNAPEAGSAPAPKKGGTPKKGVVRASGKVTAGKGKKGTGKKR